MATVFTTVQTMADTWDHSDDQWDLEDHYKLEAGLELKNLTSNNVPFLEKWIILHLYHANTSFSKQKKVMEYLKYTKHDGDEASCNACVSWKLFQVKLNWWILTLSILLSGLLQEE